VAHYVGLCLDTEAGEDDDVNDPEYNFMLDNINDDDDDEEIRNDKATKVSSMSIYCNALDLFLTFYFELHLSVSQYGLARCGYMGV